MGQIFWSNQASIKSLLCKLCLEIEGDLGGFGFWEIPKTGLMNKFLLLICKKILGCQLCR